MSLFVVDVEADGPCPGLYSMVSFGAVRVQREPHDCFFYGKTAPNGTRFNPEALAACNTTREQHLTYENPEVVIRRFSDWLKANSTGKPIFISDNPAFDWQWLNYNFHLYLGENPFGFSARRIGDFYAGLQKDFFAASRWKRLRKTAHTHHPVDDARGNVEALISMADTNKVRIPLG